MYIGKKLLAGALILSLLLTGCGRQSTEEPRRVALIGKSLESEFFKSVYAGASAAASEYNVKLTMDAPATEEDAAGQNQLIAQAVADGAEALVLSAISYEGNAEAVNAAADAGLHVVVIDSDVKSDRVQIRIGTDNKKAGQMAAQVLTEGPEEIVVGLVNYAVGSRNGQEREHGFRLTAANSDRVRRIYTINVLAESTDAREKTMELLLENPQINALVAFNEPTCVGAAQAVEELGLAGKIRMVGFDSNVEAVDMMQSGVISALVVQKPYAMGYLGVEAAWKLLNGEGYAAGTFVDTSTMVVDQDTMFTQEGQKALFSFH